MKPLFRAIAFVFKLGLGVAALAIPLLGAWAGSSLAAFLNGPRWVAPLVALLAFPVLPLLWDAYARRKRREDSKQILTFVDRMIIRTLAVNLLFLGTFLFVSPKTLFTAMSARGDWMLDDAGEGSTITSIRDSLFATVDGLEWAFGGTVSDNAYEELVDDDAPPPDLRDSIDERDASDIPRDREPDREPDRVPEREPEEGVVAPPLQSDEAWPFAHSLHPAIASIPPSAEASIGSLAAYVVAEESNHVQRVKALHDWVAQHVRYDVGLLRAIERGERPDFSSQEAEAVFSGRVGVCAGYANLMKALADAAGIEMVVVVGHTRHSAEVGGVGHAWNAVKIDERWYLIDATWDAGYVNGDDFTARYSADYLLTPSRAFGLNHFPDDAAWQLLAEPISRAEFMRQPNMRPSFFEHGLSLESPTRSQVTVSGDVVVQLNNPRRTWTMVQIMPKNGGAAVQCGVSNDAELSLRCPVSTSGFYTLRVLLGEQHYGDYVGVGEIEVVRR